MKGVLLSIALMVQALPAAAQQWRAVDFMDPGTADDRIVYLDTAGVKRPSDTTRQMTIANVYAQRQKLVSGKEYDWIELTYALDCTSRTARSIGSVAKDQGRVVSTTTTAGQPIKFDANLAVSRAATAACKGDYEYLRQQTTALFPHARTRFRHRDKLIASMKSTDWWRTGLGGQPGNRTAMFVDRKSIVAEAAPIRSAVVLLVAEGTPPTGHLITLSVDCASGTRSQVISQSFSTGKPLIIFPDNGSRPLNPQAVFGSVRRAICASDYAGARSFAILPDQIPAVAFER